MEMEILSDKIVGYITLYESDMNKWRISYLTEYPDVITVLVVQNPECMLGADEKYVISHEDEEYTLEARVDRDELYILISYSGWWLPSHVDTLNTQIMDKLSI